MGAAGSESGRTRAGRIGSPFINKIKRSVERIRAHWTMVLAGAVFFGGATVLSTIGTYRTFIDPPPGALEVADAETKQAVSRDFIETTWRRYFRMRQFLARVRRDAPADEIELAWGKLLESVEEMAAKTMIYIISFSELYGDDRRTEYENIIQPRFTNLTARIVDLRYDVKKGVLSGIKLSCQIWDIEKELDDFNIDLYQFASCFDKRARTERGCRTGISGPPHVSDRKCPFEE